MEQELADEGAWLDTGGDMEGWMWYGSVTMAPVVEVGTPELVVGGVAPAISSRELTMSRSLLLVAVPE